MGKCPLETMSPRTLHATRGSSVVMSGVVSIKISGDAMTCNLRLLESLLIRGSAE